MIHSSNTKSLRIGFLTSTDPKNRRSWSGLHYMLGQTLEKYVGNVEYLGPVSLRYLFGAGDKFNLLINRITGGKRYHYSVSVLIARLYGYIFQRKLRGKQFDLLFAPAAYTEFAYLETAIPIVYCCDSTITQLIDYYAGLSQLLPISKRELAYIEQRAISKASLLVYSSQWAANSALQEYSATPDKVVVLPFGANFPVVLPRERVLHHPRRKECQLLFVGVEWIRKGGAIAFDTLVALRTMGVDARLTICGCLPPPGYEHEHLTVIPFLDKNDEQQLQQMVDLYLAADFFLLPTRAECAAIAFCEASSFGVPSFTTDTGGIAEFVVEGVNGYRLNLTATGTDFARHIKAVFEDEALYAQLRISSRDLYEEKLNWSAWGNTMKHILESKYGKSI
jgi:glycosyltransferase involved in cell wall biosynthesis